MHRRPDFSFPGSPARGPMERAPLPPRPSVNATAPRPREEEEVRWLQASLQASPDNYYSSSGTPSPQLWSSSHQDQHRPYAGSSPSRAQAIAGYRREILELVRGLPESAYELSLRDIVEHHHRPPSPSPSSSSAPLPTPPLPPPPPPPSSTRAAARDHEPATTGGGEAEQGAKQSRKQGRKQGRAATMMRRQRSRSLERSVSLDTGLLIKFFMPLSIGKKKVSPKPDAAAKDAKKKKKQKQRKEQEPIRQQEEEELWSKSDAGSSTRTSSTGSSNSNSSAGSSARNGGSNPKAPPVRSRSRKRNGCYAFFRANKSKSGVSQE